MTVAKDWARAITEPLPSEWAAEAARLAHEPATAARFTLPLSPGINGWWEPLTVYRDGRRVASLHLTKEAEAYTQMVWIAMRRQTYTPQRMAHEFADMWLLLRLDVYAISPLAFDADAHTKPCQDIICNVIGVNDARVRVSVGTLRLDPSNPRLEVTIEGYRAWDAGGEGRGPWYMMRSKRVGASLLTEPVLVTARKCKAGLLDAKGAKGAA